MTARANSQATTTGQRRLSAADAIDIWIARWLRVRRKDILARYDCDPRRLYEIWEEITFIGSRERAIARFKQDYAPLVGQTDFSAHRRIPRVMAANTENQLDLFR